MPALSTVTRRYEIIAKLQPTSRCKKLAQGIKKKVGGYRIDKHNGMWCVSTGNPDDEGFPVVCFSEGDKNIQLTVDVGAAHPYTYKFPTSTDDKTIMDAAVKQHKKYA